jgi:uncharacterized membrane protein YvbJ
LRVCPQCSLAWETDAEWCASCGTAFDARDRESVTRVRPGRTGERAAARNPRSRRAPAAQTRKTGERAAAHAPIGRTSKPRAKAAKAPRRRSGGWAFAMVVIAMVPVAFLLGQQTRPSKAQVDQTIKQAVELNTRSAEASAQRTLQRQKHRLQVEFNARVKAAEAQAYSEGKANAEAQQPQGGFTGDLKRCLANLFEC